MTALYHLEHRLQVPAETVEAVRIMCRPSDSFSWVGDRRLRIHTWRGVPGKHCDVLLDDGVYRAVSGEQYVSIERPSGMVRWSAPWLLACDIGRKEGRYDGKERWRVTIRDLQPQSQPELNPPQGRLSIEESAFGAEHTLDLIARWAGGIWAQSFPQLHYEIDPRTDYVGIMIRQADLYYKHIWPREAEQIRALAAEWALRPEVLAERDINQLNRRASQALYRFARDLGWRKLTLQERRKLGFADEGQWQLVERIEKRRLELGMLLQPLIGAYTLDAAAGAVIHLPLGVCPQCHELADECECME